MSLASITCSVSWLKNKIVEGGKQILNYFGGLAYSIVTYITYDQYSIDNNTNNGCYFMRQLTPFQRIDLLFYQILQLLRQTTGVDILIGLSRDSISQLHEAFADNIQIIRNMSADSILLFHLDNNTQY